MKSSFNFGQFINQIKPSLEALTIGVLLAVADTLLNLASSGQSLNWKGVAIASGAAAIDYLTSFYRKKRGDIAVAVAKEVIAQSPAASVEVPMPVIAEVVK